MSIQSRSIPNYKEVRSLRQMLRMLTCVSLMQHDLSCAAGTVVSSNNLRSLMRLSVL